MRDEGNAGTGVRGVILWILTMRGLQHSSCTGSMWHSPARQFPWLCVAGCARVAAKPEYSASAVVVKVCAPVREL